jgi:hypothetical protein
MRGLGKKAESLFKIFANSLFKNLSSRPPVRVGGPLGRGPPPLKKKRAGSAENAVE